MAKFLKVELVYGAIARDQTQKDTLRGLGLRRREQQRILKDTPSIRGLIYKVREMVRFEETSESSLPKRAKVSSYQLGPVPAARPPKEKQVKVAAVKAEKNETAKAAPKKSAKPTSKKKA